MPIDSLKAAEASGPSCDAVQSSRWDSVEGALRSNAGAANGSKVTDVRFICRRIENVGGLHRSGNLQVLPRRLRILDEPGGVPLSVAPQPRARNGRSIRVEGLSCSAR